MNRDEQSRLLAGASEKEKGTHNIFSVYYLCLHSSRLSMKQRK